MRKYVEVLDLWAQQAQTEAAQAQLRLQRTQQQLARLQQLGLTAQLKKNVAPVALYANAAGFRSGVLEMAHQCRDACGVQQLELRQAQQQVHQAMQRHQSMQSIWQRNQDKLVQEQQRAGQKTMDEMAGQAWMRSRASSHRPENC